MTNIIANSSGIYAVNIKTDKAVPSNNDKRYVKTCIQIDNKNVRLGKSSNLEKSKESYIKDFGEEKVDFIPIPTDDPKKAHSICLKIFKQNRISSLNGKLSEWMQGVVMEDVIKKSKAELRKHKICFANIERDCLITYSDTGNLIKCGVSGKFENMLSLLLNEDDFKQNVNVPITKYFDLSVYNERLDSIGYELSVDINCYYSYLILEVSIKTNFKSTFFSKTVVPDIELALENLKSFASIINTVSNKKFELYSFEIRKEQRIITRLKKKNGQDVWNQDYKKVRNIIIKNIKSLINEKTLGNDVIGIVKL